MSNELTTNTTNIPVAPIAPPQNRERGANLNAGALEIEMQKAISEVQGKIYIAQRCPRNEAEARQRILDAMSNPALAEQALYSYPRSGETIVGLSIRAVEEMARLWRNLEYGIVELSNENGIAEMKAYCWDMESNVTASKTFKVPLERHTKKSVTPLTDPREQYEHSANMGARRLRAMILALLPAHIVEAAEERVKQTLAGKAEIPISQRVATLIENFARFGVTREHIELKLNKQTKDIFPDDLVTLRAIYTSLSKHGASPADFFDVQKIARPDEAADALNAALNVQKKPAEQGESTT